MRHLLMLLYLSQKAHRNRTHTSNDLVLKTSKEAQKREKITSKPVKMKIDVSGFKLANAAVFAIFYKHYIAE